MMTLLDSLYCEEKHQWEDEEDEVGCHSCVDNDDIDPQHTHLTHPTVLQQDLFWEEDEELYSLISKESEQHSDDHRSSAVHHRREAVEWILAVVSHYSFTAVTAVLAVNYLDRYLDGVDSENHRRQPWMNQLAAVSCLSLAAKVEETHVPLLLDLQMEGSRYVFEAKTIQKMEILILSTLQWRMNPITPLSFLDYIIRRLGLKNYLSSEFLKRCECLILCILPDGRFRRYLPSVIATATMAHIINSLDSCIGIEYQSQLLGILGINNKEKVEDCSRQIQEISRNSGRYFNKRKFGSVPGSPKDVMDLCFSSDESWSSAVTESSSPEPREKKSRLD